MPTQIEPELFKIPVTKQWIEQCVLVYNKGGMSQRDIKEALKTLFDYERSIGWINTIINTNAKKANRLQDAEDLSKIIVSANDELFDKNKPILSAICTHSLYCPLLEKVTQRDKDSWAITLWDLADKGYAPHSVILDGLNSLHAGHKIGLNDVRIIYDTFHILQDISKLKHYTSNRLKSYTTNVLTIESKIEQRKGTKSKKLASLVSQLSLANTQYNAAKLLHDNISTISSWLQHDILVVAGVDYQSRLNLLKFTATCMQEIEHALPHRITPIRKTLQNKADKLLGFVKTLEEELILYAQEMNCDIHWLWEICYLQKYSISSTQYHHKAKILKHILKQQYYTIEQGVIAIMDNIEKTSSVVENLNGRVRKYLRSHINVSQLHLSLLRFIMNHSSFERSRCAHRVHKSPAEILHNKPHRHWLEMLDYHLFKRAA